MSYMKELHIDICEKLAKVISEGLVKNGYEEIDPELAYDIASNCLEVASDVVLSNQ